MGRFVYQPVPKSMEAESKHGQILADIYSGHISTNHNNVIVSATKRIEDKMEDVFQIQDNIIEQKNNINNLNEDYYSVVNVSYVSAVKNFNDLKLNTVIINGGLSHLEKGMGESDLTENTILNNLYDSIESMLNLYTSSAGHHTDLINSILSTYNGNTHEFPLTEYVKDDPSLPEVTGTVTNYNIVGYIKKLSDSISSQRSLINILKNNLLARGRR